MPPSHDDHIRYLRDRSESPDIRPAQAHSSSPGSLIVHEGSRTGRKNGPPLSGYRQRPGPEPAVSQYGELPSPTPAKMNDNIPNERGQIEGVYASKKALFHVYQDLNTILYTIVIYTDQQI